MEQVSTIFNSLLVYIDYLNMTSLLSAFLPIFSRINMTLKFIPTLYLKHDASWQFFSSYNDFDNNIRPFWQRYQHAAEFCDVTLVCENKQIKTHKIIISSFSPVLNKNLEFNQNSNPLIHLRRVTFRDL